MPQKTPFARKHYRVAEEVKEMTEYLMAKAHVEFASYVELVNFDWIRARHLEYICQNIQQFLEGEKHTVLGAARILILSIPPQHGKFLPANTPILTTNGWKNHGELIMGDMVFGQDGKPKMVLGNSGTYEWNVQRILFQDGKEILASKEHLWKLKVEYDDHKGRRKRIMETQDIFNKKHKRSPYIDFCKPLVIPDRELPIDPYLLGCWLGDGTSTSGYLTIGTQDIKYFGKLGVSSLAREGIYRVRIEGFTSLLKKNNLFKNKHIPIEYLLSSIEQRTELLQGLMDTDGCVDKRGNCEFTQMEGKLADDVAVLLYSLGYKARLKNYDAMLYDRKVGIKTRILFNPNKNDKIFKLERKANRLRNKQKSDRDDKYKLFIKEIRPYGIVIGNCITVAGGMYLAGRELIPTHNSYAVTETLPSWVIGKDPSKRIILLSYGEDLALKFGRRNKKKIAEWGETLWGIKLSKHKKSDATFEIEGHIGSVISRGIMSGIVGNPADLILIDDPIKNREQADSPRYREKIWDEFMNSIYTRLSANGKIILIMTRWHEDDLAGKLITAKLLPMVVINLPCEAEENDPIGRKVGEPLFGEYGKDEKWLKQTKSMYLDGTNLDINEMGSGVRAWNALYQGRPVAKEGNMIKREWWQYYEALPSEFDEAIISIDCSFKGEEEHSFVVLQAWGKLGNNFYLIDQIRKHLNFTETLEVIRVFTRRHLMCRVILVEDKANGPAVINVLKKEIIGIIAINPLGSKKSRVSAISPAIESKHCFLPKYCSWASDFIDECSSFPDGKYDDMVDAMSQALQRLYFLPGKLRNIKPKGFYSPVELRLFNERNNIRTGSFKRPGKLKGEKKDVGKFNISY